MQTDLQILQNKAAQIILVCHPRSSATDALEELSWEDLESRGSRNRAIFIYKCQNNCFSHRFVINSNKDYHGYNTKSKSNIRKTSASHKWGHWTAVNVASNDWNELDPALRAAKDLRSFKRLLLNRKRD